MSKKFRAIIFPRSAAHSGRGVAQAKNAGRFFSTTKFPRRKKERDKLPGVLIQLR
jgi:hypothetical protein